MVNLVEILFGIAIGSALVGVLAFIQSRAGGDRKANYTQRMKTAFMTGGIALALAAAGEIYIRM
jgi:hypothetical protein